MKNGWKRMANYILDKKATVRLDESNHNLNENEDLAGSLLDLSAVPNII